MGIVGAGDELVDVVDEHDRVVGTKPRAELDDHTDRWRIVSLVVHSSSGEHVLLARRCATKRHDPGLWAPCVAGTVSAGDHYLDTVLRETHEEIGVRVEPHELTELYRGPWGSPGHLRMMAMFAVARDLDTAEMVWDRTEADALSWFSLGRLRRELARTPEQFTVGVPRIVELLDSHLARRP
jgi:NADH pyrophosphatase NudC (nudix superfamily)